MHGELLRALESVIDPELGRSVIELDMVRRAELVGGTAEVTIALTVAGCPLRASFQDQVDRALLPLDGVERTALTFDVMTPEEKTALTTKLRGGVAERTPGISVDSKTRVLAVASGKGGVGKSSLSANLAAAFSQLGHRTGILDADVYGHSIPHMLGIHQRPVVVDKMIVPPVRGDLKVMSIGFFLDDNQPVMWRGPMLHRALEQFLSDVHWGSSTPSSSTCHREPVTSPSRSVSFCLAPRRSWSRHRIVQRSRSRSGPRRWPTRRRCGCSASWRT